jgi:MFS family permease
MAIGLLGIGSGLGFFAGPQFAGYRAQTATWDFAAVSSWQRPCVEAGIAGFILGLIFLAFGSDVPGRHTHERGPKLGRKLSRTVLALCAVLGWRDFAALGTISLTSIYLQRACGKSVAEAGLIVGSMMLLGIIANPLATFLTPGRRRLPALAIVCVAGGAILLTTPWWPSSLLMIPLSLYQTTQLGSYAISDAATLERVSPNVRGRVVGVFLTCAGTWAGASAWCMGWWTDRLGEGATHPLSYIGPFAALSAMMWIAAFSPLIIRRLGEVTGEKPVTAAEEISPATMEGAF